MEPYINMRGYVVFKKSLTVDELETIKRELTVEPRECHGYGDKTPPFKVYLESENKLYLPKYWALKRFGVPKSNKLLDSSSTIDILFNGSLREMQKDPVKLMLNACCDPTKMGSILSLKCGEGKTVCAIYAMCELKKKTIIICHKEFLLMQWKERILEYTNIDPKRIGIIKAQALDVEDKDVILASLQSLVLKRYDPQVFDGIGLSIFDECHHTSASTFSKVFQKLNTQYTIGLSATTERKDGLSCVFKWHIGDIAFKSKQRKDEVIVRLLHFDNTDKEYCHEAYLWNNKPNVARMINNICDFRPRVEFIVDEICSILHEDTNRRFLVLSDRRSHLKSIHDLLKERNLESAFYYGGMKPIQLKNAEESPIILSTIQYSSEGLDIKGLNTLVLASPKSDIVQVCGRILRDKVEDRVYTPLIIDIVDNFSVFYQQAKKRHAYYKKCKYTIIDEDNLFKHNIANNKEVKLEGNHIIDLEV